MINAIQSKGCLVILKFTFIRTFDILYISPLRGGEVYSPISICHSKLIITKFILTENLNFSFDGFFLCLARISLPPVLFVRSANLLTLLLYNICYTMSRLFTKKTNIFTHYATISMCNFTARIANDQMLVPDQASFSMFSTFTIFV